MRSILRYKIALPFSMLLALAPVDNAKAGFFDTLTGSSTDANTQNPSQAGAERRKPQYNPSGGDSSIVPPPVSASAPSPMAPIVPAGVNYVEPVVAQPLPPAQLPVATNNKRTPPAQNQGVPVLSEPQVKVSGVEAKKDFPKLSEVPEKPAQFKSSADVRKEVRALEIERNAVQKASKHPWEVREAETKVAPKLTAQKPLPKDEVVLQEKLAKAHSYSPVITAKEPEIKPVGLKPLTLTEPKVAAMPAPEIKPVGIKEVQKVSVGETKVSGNSESAPMNLKEPQIASAAPLQLREPIAARQQGRILPESRYAARRMAERRGN